MVRGGWDVVFSFALSYWPGIRDPKCVVTLLVVSLAVGQPSLSIRPLIGHHWIRFVDHWVCGENS